MYSQPCWSSGVETINKLWVSLGVCSGTGAGSSSKWGASETPAWACRERQRWTSQREPAPKCVQVGFAMPGSVPVPFGAQIPPNSLTLRDGEHSLKTKVKTSLNRGTQRLEWIEMKHCELPLGRPPQNSPSQWWKALARGSPLIHCRSECRRGKGAGHCWSGEIYTQASPLPKVMQIHAHRPKVVGDKTGQAAAGELGASNPRFSPSLCFPWCAHTVCLASPV